MHVISGCFGRRHRGRQLSGGDDRSAAFLDQLNELVVVSAERYRLTADQSVAHIWELSGRMVSPNDDSGDLFDGHIIFGRKLIDGSVLVQTSHCREIPSRNSRGRELGCDQGISVGRIADDQDFHVRVRVVLKSCSLTLKYLFK